MAITGANNNDPEAQQIELLKGIDKLSTSQREVAINLSNLKNTIVNVIQKTDSSINQLKDSMNRQSEALLNYFKGQSAKKLLDVSNEQSAVLDKLSLGSNKAGKVASAAISEAMKVSDVVGKLDSLIQSAKENSNSDLVERMLTAFQKTNLFDSALDKLVNGVSDKTGIEQNKKLIDAISKDKKADRTVISNLLSRLSNKFDEQEAPQEDQDLASRTLEVLQKIDSKLSKDNGRAKTTAELFKSSKPGNGMFSWFTSGMTKFGMKYFIPVGNTLVSIAKALPVMTGIFLGIRDSVIYIKRIKDLLDNWESEDNKRNRRNQREVEKAAEIYRQKRTHKNVDKAKAMGEAREAIELSLSDPEKSKEQIAKISAAGGEGTLLDAAREIALNRLSKAILAIQSSSKAKNEGRINSAGTVLMEWGKQVIHTATADLNKAQSLGEIQQVMTQWMQKILIEGPLLLKRFNAMYTASQIFDDQIKETLSTVKALTSVDLSTKNYSEKLGEDFAKVKDVEVEVTGWLGSKTKKISELTSGDTPLAYPYQTASKNFKPADAHSNYPQLINAARMTAKPQLAVSGPQGLISNAEIKQFDAPSMAQYNKHKKLDVNTPEGYYEAVPQKYQIPYGFADANRDGVVTDSELFPALVKEVDGDLLQFSDQVKKVVGLDHSRYITALEEYAKAQIDSNNLSREQLDAFQKMLTEMINDNRRRVSEFNNVQVPSYNMNINTYGVGSAPAQPKR